jgi:hypothetical protein
VAHGADWYTNERYSGPRSFPAPTDFQPFAGHYRAGGVWLGSMRVVLRKGRLWLDGISPLAPLDQALFRMEDDPYNPATAEFFYVAKAKRS